MDNSDRGPWVAWVGKRDVAGCEIRSSVSFLKKRYYDGCRWVTYSKKVLVWGNAIDGPDSMSTERGGE